MVFVHWANKIAYKGVAKHINLGLTTSKCSAPKRDAYSTPCLRSFFGVSFVSDLPLLFFPVHFHLPFCIRNVCFSWSLGVVIANMAELFSIKVFHEFKTKVNFV